MPKGYNNVHDLMVGMGINKSIISNVDNHIKSHSASSFLTICAACKGVTLDWKSDADNSNVKVSDFIDCLDRLGYTVKVIATPKGGDGKDRIEGDL